MARLAEEVIERIKQDISLVRLIESQGHTLKKHGKDYILNCPFHDDKTASLVITPKTNLWHCLGACQKGGSVIDWVMQTQSVSFRFACELLQKDWGLVAGSGNQPIKQNTTTKLPPPLAADADSQTALRDVVNYYHETLKQSPEAQDYLRSRGLDNAELIERFKLGYANRTLGYHLPAKNRKAGAELRGKLQDIGILRKSGHEHFNGSLVVPVIMPKDGRYADAPGGSASVDENGLITEVYGRKIQGNKLRKGTAQHLYLPGPHDGVWNIKAFMSRDGRHADVPGGSTPAQSHDEIILCEALIDAMTFWVNGFRNVTASYGTSGFSASHLAAFKTYAIKRVLIAYDRDEAGNKAAQQLAEKLQKEGIECFRVLLPKGMDVNEYAMNQDVRVSQEAGSRERLLTTTPAAKALGLVIRKAEWMGKGEAPQRALLVEAESVPVRSENETHHSPLAAKEKKPEPEAPIIPEPTHATPMPTMLGVEIEAEITDHDIKIPLGKRLYRIRGLHKNMSYEQLKINLLVSLGESIHVDQLELYNAKARHSFIKQAAIELGVKDDVIKKDLGKVLLKLEALQDEQIKNALEQQAEKSITLTDEQQQQALDYLRDPSLLSRLLHDFNACGVVGEETNKLVGYLACVSRKLDKPLAVIIQSSSAAGKSSLMDAVLNLMPEEERIQYSAMTGQSLFYMGETNLQHKILAIAEEEGAEQASYALKLLQSDGEVSIASTGKNETTGNLETKSYTVQGPVMLFLTTTAIDIDEELLNRCVVLTVNESREQTEAIHALQRKSQTLEGLLLQESKKQLITLHRNVQRMIRPLNVVNPYAEQLTFLSDKTRTRRDHMKYLQLINSIALLHQYQRDIKTIVHQNEVIEYIDVTLEDIEHANRLAHDVLGRSLDELPPQTRKLLHLIYQMVSDACRQEQIEQQDYRFTRKQIREGTGWGNTQLKTHLGRLEDMEYLLIHRGGRGNSIAYELLYSKEGESGNNRLYGLIEPQNLQAAPEHPCSRGTRASCASYDAQKSGVKPDKSGASRPHVGAVSGAGRGEENAGKSVFIGDCAPSMENRTKNAVTEKNNGQSYRSDPLPLTTWGTN